MRVATAELDVAAMRSAALIVLVFLSGCQEWE
jgi:hypothetical protein